MNLGDLKTRISQRLLDPNNTSVSDEVITQAINDTIDYWKVRRFWFNEGRTTVQLTLDDPVIPLPSDFLVGAFDQEAFNVEYSNMRYPLAHISETRYDAVWLGNGHGIPAVYTRKAPFNDYRVYPIPDRAYDLNVSYLKDYTDLSVDADENDFTDYAPRLLILWTLADLHGEWFQDEKMETYFRGRADAEYKNLLTMARKSNATGELEISSTLIC